MILMILIKVEIENLGDEQINNTLHQIIFYEKF